METPPLLLASSSPRRRELLSQIGVSHETVAIDIDETLKSGERPDHYVCRLAEEKARAAAGGGRRRPVLAADTAVVLGDRVFGKPENEAHAVAMLLALADRTHQVMSAVAVTDGERLECRLQVSEVTFGPISEATARRYWQTGEPADKAGAYAIQGRAAVFVTRLSGSFSGVMGLPLHETATLLREFGIPVLGSQ